jgi:hypothetical protein
MAHLGHNIFLFTGKQTTADDVEAVGLPGKLQIICENGEFSPN